jgi:hypothetical protein
MCGLCVKNGVLCVFVCELCVAMCGVAHTHTAPLGVCVCVSTFRRVSVCVCGGKWKSSKMQLHHDRRAEVPVCSRLSAFRFLSSMVFTQKIRFAPDCQLFGFERPGAVGGPERGRASGPSGSRCLPVPCPLSPLSPLSPVSLKGSGPEGIRD